MPGAQDRSDTVETVTARTSHAGPARRLASSTAVGHDATRADVIPLTSTPARPLQATLAWRAPIIEVLQQLVGNRAVTAMLQRIPDGRRRPAEVSQVQRFASDEHRILGDAGSSGATVDLDIGDPAHPLSHGELVALSGDYFASPAEIMNLAASGAGKAQIRCARFDALRSGDPGTISKETKKQVKDRYYRLAAANFSHFADGGTAAGSYEEQHRTAMQQAFMAGATEDATMSTTSEVTEAFSQHYLTDMFSAGHIRTPRIDIKVWYEAHLPGSVDHFISYVSDWITERLDSYGDIPSWCPNWKISSGIRPKIRELGGAAVDSFSLGDIVSLALHDRDNRLGLWVKSDVDLSGTPVAGGYSWPEKAMGDNHLGESAMGAAMAEAAVRASLRETTAAKTAGARTPAGRCLPPETLQASFSAYMNTLTSLSAFGYVPHDDVARNAAYITGPTAAPSSGPIDYRWGTLDDVTRAEVDSIIKTTIAGQLAGMTASVAPPHGIVEEANIAEWLPGLGPDMVGHNLPLITLHIRKAFTDFCGHLRESGIHAIETAVGLPAQRG